jgi:hypothetical protein
MSTPPDVTLAYADRMLYEAAFTGFYGELTFMFKHGTIVLVRRSETVIPSTPTTDEPTGREAPGANGAYDQDIIRHRR